MNFIDKSKQAHADYETKPYWEGAFHADNDDTVRHYRMLGWSIPILRLCGVKSILTVGDNRGRDAGFLKRSLGARVVASDLRTAHLQRAVEMGHVDAIQDVDVERMPFDDGAFDFVFAKETFHHWPRPMLGFYECLRVAKLGVLLIEPNDCKAEGFNVYPQNSEYHDAYEAVGNYKYQISLREMQKAAWSLYLPCVIARGFNDPYRPGQSMEEYIKDAEHLDRLGVENKRCFNLMVICVLKAEIGGLREGLDQSYKFFYRPKNGLEKV